MFFLIAKNIKHEKAFIYKRVTCYAKKRAI